MPNESTPTEYLPVPAETICENTAPPFAVYMRTAEEKFVLFLAGDTLMTARQRERLRQSGGRLLYLHPDNEEAYYRYLGDNLQQVLNDPLTSFPHKASIVYDTASHLMHDVLRDPQEAGNIRRATEVAKNTASLVGDHDQIEDILALTNFDYTTHTHSVNVCVYGLALARHLGHRDPRLLGELSIGLLLHDVGKSLIDPNILNKPGRLTPEEFEVMKHHPALGGQALHQHGNIPVIAMHVVLEHHERMNGQGYPRALTDGKIHPLARLAAIVDVFDALTTRRPYKEPLSTFEALRLMRDDSGHHDEPMLGAFIAMLAGR